MNRIMIIIATVFLACANVWADGDGGYAGTFMRGGIGARPLGMGGAFTAVAEGAEAPYYNPAGLGFIVMPTVTMSYRNQFLDRHTGYFAFSFPIKNEAAMAISWINNGTSSLPGRGESRQPLGDIQNNQNSFALSFSKALTPKISFGMNLRYIAEKYDGLDAFSIGAGAGALYIPHKMVKIGAVLENLGSNYRWNSQGYWSDGGSYNENFPIIFRFGVAGNLLSGALIPAVDIEKNTKQGIKIRTGSEYWVIKKVIKKIEDEYEEGTFIEVEEIQRFACLRAGLDNGTPSFGATYNHYIKRFIIGLEYAFSLGKESTSAGHLMTLNVSF